LQALLSSLSSGWYNNKSVQAHLKSMKGFKNPPEACVTVKKRRFSPMFSTGIFIINLFARFHLRFSPSLVAPTENRGAPDVRVHRWPKASLVCPCIHRVSVSEPQVDRNWITDREDL